MSVRILSVIILYHPQLDSVSDLIKALHQQNSDIIIIDNSPNSHQSSLAPLLHAQDQYQHYPENIGLGAGHNIAIAHALNENYEFLLIFDQDSTIKPDFIEALHKSFMEISQVAKLAAVGPSYTDRRFGTTHRATIHTVKAPTERRMIISSGSLFSVTALKEVGLMDAALFIDFIDTEWCYRAHQNGYKVYQSATAIMEHHLGEVKPILFGLYKMRYMSPMRYFYFTRNLRRLTREHRISPASIYAGFMKHLPAMLIKCLFLTPKKLYLQNFIKGLKAP